MNFKQFLLMFFIVYCNLHDETYGQDECVPLVQSISIAANATLWWDVDTSRACEITSFAVHVTGDGEDEYRFTVTDNFIDLSFLEVCEKWQFTVTPYSYDVVGFSHTMTGYIPLPPNADLTINTFRFSISGRSVILSWELRNPVHGDCTLEYRLSLQDLDLGTIEDVYVEGKSARLDSMSPCITYEINLRAINQAHPTIEGPMTRLNLQLSRRVQVAPILKSVDSQATSINMTWSLEGDANRCPLRNFYIEGGSYFNSTTSLQGVTNPATVTVQVNNLRPNSMYYMRASVENSAGTSQATPIAVQTLELSSN